MKALSNYITILENIEELIKLTPKNSNLLQKILDTRKECVKIISQYDIMKLIIQINNSEQESVESVESVEEIKQDVLKDQMSDLSNLLGGQQDIDVNNFDPKVFDTFGRGIGSLFNITPQNTIQIKTENNKINIDNNLTFQIKKKV